MRREDDGATGRGGRARREGAEAGREEMRARWQRVPAHALQRAALLRLLEEQLHEPRTGPGRPLRRQVHLLLEQARRAQLALPFGAPAQQAPAVVQLRHAEGVGLEAGRALQPDEQALGEGRVRHAHLGRREAGIKHSASPVAPHVVQPSHSVSVSVPSPSRATRRKNCCVLPEAVRPLMARSMAARSVMLAEAAAGTRSFTRRTTRTRAKLLGRK